LNIRRFTIFFFTIDDIVKIRFFFLFFFRIVLIQQSKETRWVWQIACIFSTYSFYLYQDWENEWKIVMEKKVHTSLLLLVSITWSEEKTTTTTRMRNKNQRKHHSSFSDLTSFSFFVHAKVKYLKRTLWSVSKKNSSFHFWDFFPFFSLHSSIQQTQKLSSKQRKCRSRGFCK
jgi:hypothetical protein